MAGALSVLLNPKSIAVVGASPSRGRARLVLHNLRNAGYSGDVYAINPRYEDVLGYKCYPSIASLPGPVDCVVALVGADAACDVLEQAHALGTRSAVVPSAGFGEGGHGEERGGRLRRLAAGGMSICGPNCFGMISVRSGAAMYSGPISFPLQPGPVAIVSQSGGLGHNAFSPLMNHRRLGFSYVISCGNATATGVEDYVDHFVDDPDVQVIACVIESLSKPELLFEAAQRARRARKSILFYQPGRSAAGQATVRSHTGALVGNSDILAAHLRRCGIVQTESYDTFIETIELFGLVPRDDKLGGDVIVVSGSGGGAAVAADALDGAGVPLAQLSAETVERVGAALPEFGSVNNPLDGTGSIYDDPKMLPKLMDAILANPGNPAIMCAVNASARTEQMRLFADIFADAARTSGRTVVAYQPNPLGGELESGIVNTLVEGGVPLMLGISEAMRALRCLVGRREFWTTDVPLTPAGARRGAASTLPADFMDLRKVLSAAGVPVVETRYVTSEREAIAAGRAVGLPVAVKAEAPGLLHKSDIGAVRLGCMSDEAVAEAYRTVTGNAVKAGFANQGALIQPMMSGIAEVYAGVICDPLLGPAVVFGLGGIFIEVLKDTITELAPLSHADATRMISSIRGAALLQGLRGRPAADTEALARLLVGLGKFAVENTGRFTALDLNPIVVKAEGQGAFAVDIALDVKAS
ncbi:acetate--CoA ligase family protein [Rhodoplanes sp. Z2-YC6860]|uniref:acetate--CoA ligase family protein n=1 Tax=Rhodoplanes sp. Z2-YC6860 TaxID=674703 RepID=UPI0018DCCF31|nr:acetate--CoA ligase family protein [Rhodoplanes sp. Z2-YC6860]